jgi:Spy/CpxP family protein refolding chaperone
VFLSALLSNEAMSNRPLIVTAFLLVSAPALVHAQVPALSPERQAAVMEASRLLNDPVEFVLQHRTALALTAEQVTALEKLRAALRDSATARTAQRMRQAQENARQPGLASAMAWAGPIDEKAIRDAMRRQSSVQAEILITSARDRRTVGALLTPEQRGRLPQLQTDEMLKAVRPAGK